MTEQRCFGVAGWKDSGKTTLVAAIIQDLTKRGLKISTMKHAHHAFDLDQQGTDSFKHRNAGAGEVLLVSENRWALQHELKGNKEPSFDEMLTKLSPCDLVIVEGYKRENIPKIEIIGSVSNSNPLWPENETIKAVACDEPIEACKLPQFRRSQIADISNFILNYYEIST